MKFVVDCPASPGAKDPGWVPSDHSSWYTRHYFKPVLSTFGDVSDAESIPHLGTFLQRGPQRETPCVYIPFAPLGQLHKPDGCLAIPAFDWEYGASHDHTADGAPRDLTQLLAQCSGYILHSRHAAALIPESLQESLPLVVVPAPVWESFSGLRARPRLETDALRVIVTDCKWYDSRETGRMQSQANAGAISLTGVVYSCVVNPDQARRNWPDLIHAFCWAFREREDATLILKLTHPVPDRALALIKSEIDKLPSFRGRVVAIAGYVTQECYHSIIGASDYFVTASCGEGQCLPMLEFMAAGKPAIAPQHSGLAEHVNPDNSIVVDCYREWVSGPEDPGGTYQTYRHMVNWQSLVEAYSKAHEFRSIHRDVYRRMSDACIEHTQRQCSEVSARKRLASLFEVIQPAKSDRITARLARWMQRLLRTQ